LAIEAAAETEPEKPAAYIRNTNKFIGTLRGDDREIKNPLAKTFRRLNNFWYCQQRAIGRLEYNPAEIVRRLSENLAAVKEMPEIRAMVAKSEKDRNYRG